jgi:hypothetical protein
MVESFRRIASASQASLALDHLWSDRDLCPAPIASVGNCGCHLALIGRPCIAIVGDAPLPGEHILQRRISSASSACLV